MVLRTQMGSTFANLEEKGPRRSVLRSEAIAESMDRFVGMWTMAPIW